MTMQGRMRQKSNARWRELKSEYRNPKYETNSNDQNTKYQNVLDLEFYNFDIVSNFDIRISNLVYRSRIEFGMTKHYG